MYIFKNPPVCAIQQFFTVCQHVFEILLNVALVLTFKMHSSVVTSVE